MSKIKKLPRRVVDKESLSEELKELYKKIYSDYKHKNILELREEARKLDIESPTTLNKEELLKRLTDYVIYDYLPKEMRKEISATLASSQIVEAKERVHGLFDVINGENRVGNVFVPEIVVKEAHLMVGDMVEGSVTVVSGSKTLFAVSSVDDDAPNPMRRLFSEMNFTDKRSFGQIIENTKAQALFPDLKMGERIILTDLTMELANELHKSFKYALGLFMGVEPEFRTDIDKGLFYAPFDLSQNESLHIARLALERAKRLCERGKNVALIVYGFDAIGNRDMERALFGSGRCFENGSITVFADVNKDREYGIYTKYATRIL